MDRKVLLGRRIREIRDMRRLSQETLAEKMGANATYLSSIERGKENPTLDFLLNLSDALDVDPVDMTCLGSSVQSIREGWPLRGSSSPAASSP